MISKLFPVLFLSSILNFCYIWFFAKNEKVCKSTLRISVVLILPSVLQSYYIFYQKGPSFNTTILIVAEFLLNLLFTSFVISFAIISLTGALDSRINKRVEERKSKRSPHAIEDVYED